MKKLRPFLLSPMSGLLLYAAWPESPLTFLIFVAFIPLLWIERQGIRRRKFFGWTYLTMVIWNIGSTWWIWNSTGPGAVGAILANSLLMCVPWLLFHWLRKSWGNTVGYLSLLVFWLSFEYFHLQNWGLSWPWLTLGNAFATHPNWVQWYEYTGVSGGGLWIMGINILLFQWLWNARMHRNINGRQAILIVLLLAIPILFSLRLIPAKQNDLPAKNIVIVQPNIDPYAKVVTGTFDGQMHTLMQLSQSAIDSNTELVVWPETAIFLEEGGGFDEDSLKQNYFLRPLWDFLHRNPRINLLTGIGTFRFFKDKHTPTAIYIPELSKYVESYNSAAIMDSSGLVRIYHKSRLVPGVETIPPFMHFLDPFFEKFGGSTGSYTGQPNRIDLPTTDNSLHIAPVICYESIYGEFVSRYVHNGADIIAIITNDGWWGNTSGHRQHENFARLRAIETRRWVVRSANTGISCVIDPAGRILESRPWDVPAVIKAQVPAEHIMTFYARYGDCISRLAILLTILVLIGHVIMLIKTKKNRG